MGWEIIGGIRDRETIAELDSRLVDGFGSATAPVGGESAKASRPFGSPMERFAERRYIGTRRAGSDDRS